MAPPIADATIMADNSLDERQAFTVCRAQLGARVLFDLRDQAGGAPSAIQGWMVVLAPR